MGIFNKTEQKIEQISFADKLSSIKSVFVTAHDQAMQLISSIRSDISSKEEMVASLKEDIVKLKNVEGDTARFIENTEQFI